MELCNLTWQEAKEWTKKNPVVIVPTGSTEQHGPHLPLKVDIVSADYIARKVAEKTDMLVTPPLNFGYSELWLHYPGTISFRQETYKAALYDICYSLIRGGFKKIFLLNGHNPNLILMQSVLYELVDEWEDQGIQLGCGTYIFMAKEACDKIGDNFRDGTHANEMETAISLALFPECVKMEEAKKVSKNYKMRKVINFDEGAIFVNRWPDSKVYAGAYGNPALGTAERGKAYLEALISKISQIILDFSKGKFNPSKSDGTAQNF
jgi:creatinine amidohydrolase